MDRIELKGIDFTEFTEKILPYYLDIFPEDERKPVDRIKYMYQHGLTKIIEIQRENIIVGFMMLNKANENGYSILDYLAIFPEYRNQGIGTDALKILLEMEKSTEGVYIEIDKCDIGQSKEENYLREKRKDFYERLGFKKLNYDLLLFNVIYTPYVFSNIPIDEEHIVEEILKIYEAGSGKERIKQNCKFIKNLSYEELNKENIAIATRVQLKIFPTASAYALYKSKVNGERKSFYVSYIAYYYDEPIGIVGLYELPEYPDTAWLSYFGVVEKYRKMGFGKQMLDFIKDIAKQNNRKFLRLYTFEIWNGTAQNFYKKNMDIEETYYNDNERRKEIFDGKPKVFGLSLCDEKIELWNNKFINISIDEDDSEKSIEMMKEDNII